MGQEIRVTERGLNAAGQNLKAGVDAYSSFCLKGLSGVIAGPGSGDHDNRLASLVRRSLESYAAVMAGDSAAVRMVGERFSGEDARLASRVFGV